MVVFKLVGHAFRRHDPGADIAGVIEDEQSAVIGLLSQLRHLDCHFTIAVISSMRRRKASD